MNDAFPILAGKHALVVGIANEHSIAYGCAQAFHRLGASLQAMDVSTRSFVRMVRLAPPHMREGGRMVAMSYHGAQKVVPSYKVMEVVKAALEAACRYLAYELGPRAIRVHAVSPGPLRTRAASGVKNFGHLLADAVARSPLGGTVDIADVGSVCACLASDHARRLTCSTAYVDGELNIVA